MFASVVGPWGAAFIGALLVGYCSRSPEGEPVITHPEKLLFPSDGISKGDLAAYYAAVAPVMLPHLRGRPVTMERFPAGIEAKGFMPSGHAARRGRQEVCTMPYATEKIARENTNNETEQRPNTVRDRLDDIDYDLDYELQLERELDAAD